MNSQESSAPRFSILTPVYNVPLDVFEKTVESVLTQEFENWQWVLVDDKSPNQAVRDYLMQLEARDERITVSFRSENGGIVAASNDCIDLARGEFIALLDHDDLLVPETLQRMDEAISLDDDADFLYSDEAIVQDGDVKGTFLKPDWSPERLRHQMYTSHISVMRTQLVRDVGGFHEGFDGSQDHDLALRVSERARSVVHVPEVLYHWQVIPGSTADASDQDAKPYAWDAGVRAVAGHVKRVGIDATVIKGSSRGHYRLLRKLESEVSVSVIFPTMGTQGLVRGVSRYYIVEAVRSLIERTSISDLEIVVVYDLVTPQEAIDELKKIAGESLTLVPFDEVFNFSRKCNVGFLHSRGDYVVFLNDDMEAYSDRPLEELIAPLSEPGVGMTGARLLFENTRHQHAGIVYGYGTVYPGHYRLPWKHGGHFGSMWVNREVSALTGACLALTRETFEAVGGFSEAFPLNYNDIDLSMKVRMQGRRLLWLQNVELFHFESVSRETRVEQWEFDLLRSRWGSPAARDTYSLQI